MTENQKQKLIEILSIEFDEETINTIINEQQFKCFVHVKNIQDFGWAWFKDKYGEKEIPDYIIKAIDFEQVFDDLRHGCEAFYIDEENEIGYHILGY